MTHFDEFYTAVEDDKRLSAEEIKKKTLCATIKTVTKREFPLDNVVPICSQWAFIARQLSCHPSDETLKERALKCLEQCVNKNASSEKANVHSLVIASELQKLSGIKELESRLVGASLHTQSKFCLHMVNFALHKHSKCSIIIMHILLK